ncbi:hypothetical protein EKD04_009375 [Chloroflexales bacterium ZM16-3]|nr:hypothetical protein [Chloroflexales bacterium ZM16-3]
MLILTNIDLNGGQLLNVVLQVLAASPPAPAQGMIYYDSTLLQARIYNGTSWDTAGGGDASLLNGQPGTYYLDFAHSAGQRDHTAIADFDTQVRASRLDQLAAPIAAVALNGQRLTGVADPTAAQDAATQAYVLSQVAGLVNSAPGVLDTLAELATALGNDPSFATTIAASIAAAKDRANHSGTQDVGTITGLTAAIDTQILGRVAVADIGDGVATLFTLTHNFGTRDVVIQVRQNASPYAYVGVDARAASANTATVQFAATSVPTAGALSGPDHEGGLAWISAA